MTNEQMVEEIRNGISVTENMERLYLNNLPLIKKFIKPYTAYEPEEDLLQEAYLGLQEATKHYETSENVLFMTYAWYWIRQQIQQYIENCGSVVKISSHYRQKIIRYKKSVQEYQQLYGREPTDQDMAVFMGITVKEVQGTRLRMAGVQSIDAPIQDGDGEICLSDTLEGDSSPENDVVDKIYDEQQRKALWGVVERYTSERQQDILKQHFLEGKTIAAIARESDQNHQTVWAQKDKALHKLRTGKAAREIRERMELPHDTKFYHSGFKSFKEHDYTSMVEYIAIRKTEFEI